MDKAKEFERLADLLMHCPGHMDDNGEMYFLLTTNAECLGMIIAALRLAQQTFEQLVEEMGESGEDDPKKKLH